MFQLYYEIAWISCVTADVHYELTNRFPLLIELPLPLCHYLYKGAGSKVNNNYVFFLVTILQVANLVVCNMSDTE